MLLQTLEAIRHADQHPALLHRPVPNSHGDGGVAAAVHAAAPPLAAGVRAAPLLLVPVPARLQVVPHACPTLLAPGAPGLNTNPRSS